jgi:hypothetical protein
VHSVWLEQMGEGLAVCSSEMVDAHCVDEPVAEASLSRSSDVAPESLVTTYGMGDTIHASADKSYLGF